MNVTGHCYCGNVAYVAEGDPIMKAQCHCRECQYVTGGSPNMFMVMPKVGFRYTRGEARGYSRSDLANPVTREFCPNCGTHLLTRAPGLPDGVILKVGAMDDPGLFGMPGMAIFTIDQQAFHTVPAGVPAFERFPG